MIKVLVGADADGSVNSGSVGCFSGGFEADIHQETEIIVASSDDAAGAGEFGILGCGGNYQH